jgi:hypothetical protein
MFGLKRDEVTVEWRKLHNEELNDLYCSVLLTIVILVIKSRRMKGAGRVVRVREKRGANNVLFANPEGKRPLGRPRRRWESNTGRFITYSGITKNHDRKTVGHVFTKTVQVEGRTQFFSSKKLFFIVVHISAARRCECM